MKKFIAFLIKNFLLTLVIFGIYFGASLSVILFYKTDSTLFPVQYFQDVDRTTDSLSVIGDGLIKEAMLSPYTPAYILNAHRFYLILALFIFLNYALYFFIKQRKYISIWVKLLIIPVCLVFIIINLWTIIVFPRYAIYPVLKHAKNSLQNNTSVEDSSAIHDPVLILKMMSTGKESPQIISGYGKYNAAVGNLVPNPGLQKLTYYQAMVIPSVARYLAEEEDADVVKNIKYQLSYYPETNQLIVNRLEGLDVFLKNLSAYLIKKLEYSDLSTSLSQKKALKEFRIVNPSEYVNYYVEKIISNNNKTIESNKNAYNTNLKVLNECQTLQASNKKLLSEQNTDYQLNCVSSIRYNNCPAFKIQIDDNQKIADELILSCKDSVALANKYNIEIQKEITQSNKNIEEVTTTGTLERNKAELGSAVFISPATIYVKNDDLVLPLINNSVHEFIHYSVSGDSRDLPNFLDEGMTDLLTMRSVGLDTYLTVAISGYYAELQIVLSLLEKIPFNELLRVYVGGNSKDFKKLFIKYFPDISYDEFIQKGKDIFNTTYEVGENKRQVEYFSTRDYMWLGDVLKIREFLGLVGDIKYSDL